MIRCKLAVRNLLRNKRRTTVSVTNLALALAAILLFSGFCESMYQGLRESMIRSQLVAVSCRFKIYELAADNDNDHNDSELMDIMRALGG